MRFFPNLNDLRILGKLRLFLGIPLIGLLFFAGRELVSDFRHWRSAEASERFMGVGTMLAALTRELQLERGLSNKHLEGDATAALTQQRGKVDRLVAQLRSNISAHPSRLLNNTPQQTEKILALVKRIDSARDAVNAEQIGNDFSEAIEDILELILQMQLVSNNLDIARSARCYNALLWLKEYAALEQITIHNLLSGRNFPALIYSELNTQIAGQDAHLTKFQKLAPAVYLDLLPDRHQSPIVDEFIRFRGAILHKAEKSLALNELQIMIGYGGLIHHFKNYVIRGDADYATRFRKIYGQARRTISKYRTLPDISAEENRNLDVIENTFGTYHKHLSTVSKMRAQGASIAAIDAKVRVDDNPAYSAISRLGLPDAQFDPQQWWNLAQTRMDLIERAIAAIETDLKQQTRSNLALTYGRIASDVMLTLAVLLATLLLGKRLKRRLVGEIVGISDKMRAIADNASQVQTLSISGNDEIAEMASTFNHLLHELRTANQQLRQSEASYRLISSLLPQHIWTTTPDGKVDFVNQRVIDYFGLTGEQLSDDGWHSVIHPDDLASCLESWNRSLTTGCEYEIEIRLRHRSGAYRWHLIRAIPQRYEDGGIRKWFGSNTDISERKQAEDKLKLAAKVFGNAHEGIMITDTQPVILDVNPVFCEITGYRAEEVVGKNPNILGSNKQSKEFYADMWRSIRESGHWQGEIWNRKKDGELYAELLTISSIVDDEGKVQNYLGLFSDITKIKYQQQILEQMAHFDVLTQLPNRTLFSDRFHQAIARSKRTKSLLAVVFLDLDGFKPINDRYGHDSGDQILIEVARRIRHSIRDEDTASRLGGDEFALLLTDIVSLDQCKQILSRICRNISQPYVANRHSITLGVSGGVTLYPLDDGDPDTLLRHADHAMYQAKMTGKNHYHFFDPGAVQQLELKNRQLQNIEAAFARREFCLYFQPKVDMRSGHVFGAEALIRWRHPQHGILSPDAFLPIIEASDLECKIGQWVIETAIEQLERWRRQGVTLELSINISSHHLLANDFVNQMRSILAKHPAIQPENVQLEILESSALGDLDHVNKVIRTLSEMINVKIALDDFGTGYSSLTHLRHLAADTVKIDQGFVRDMMDDPNDYSIIEGVISLSQALHRQVIAEGVETTEHGLLLLMQGCFLAQGYGIAPPMPGDELPRWLATYRCPGEWLELARHPYSERLAALELLRLTDKHWVRRLQDCLNSPTDTLPNWPIMTYHLCHCGRWMKLAQSHGNLDGEQLRHFEKAHKKLHHIGSTLMNHYLEGDRELAQDGLIELHHALADIEHLLRQAEEPAKSH